MERLLHLLEELHVGPPPLLEAKVHSRRRVQREEILQRLQQKRERRLKVHAVSRENGVGPEVLDLLRKWIAPGCSTCWLREQAIRGQLKRMLCEMLCLDCDARTN